MDLTVCRETIGIQLWLPLDQAVAFLRDPRAAQAEVRRGLQGGGIDPDTGKMIERHQCQLEAAVARRYGTMPEAPAKSRVACPWPGCGKMVPAAGPGRAAHRRMHEREAGAPPMATRRELVPCTRKGCTHVSLSQAGASAHERGHQRSQKKP